MPNNFTLVSEKLDYLDYQTISITKDITAIKAYKITISHQPKWLVILFKIRDFLISFLVLNPLTGLINLNSNVTILLYLIV